MNPLFAQAFGILRARGHTVAIDYPEQQLVRLDSLRIDADLYLLKSDTELALSLALALEHMGAHVLNSAAASALVKDKVQASLVLADAGIPTPRSLAAGQSIGLTRALQSGPLIVKPHRGYHGVGISIVETLADLSSIRADDEVVFAQALLTQGRRDLKVYGIGDNVFGVRKPFAADSYLQTGHPAELSKDVDGLAHACASATGLRLFGLDIAETPDGPLVLDVNYFPGYRGVPDAARRLAEFIERTLRRGR